MLERIRMYSKYLTEDNTIFMDFNSSGKLTFLAINKNDEQLLIALINKLCLIDNLYIEKIFSNNEKIQEHIKKAISSEKKIKNKKLYEV